MLLLMCREKIFFVDPLLASLSIYWQVAISPIYLGGYPEWYMFIKMIDNGHEGQESIASSYSALSELCHMRQHIFFGMSCPEVSTSKPWTRMPIEFSRQKRRILVCFTVYEGGGKEGGSPLWRPELTPRPLR